MLHTNGFQSRKSTVSNLLESVSDWIFSIDSRNNIDVVYLDLKKAFESVVHSKLLLKISQIGICGDLFDWLVCYLSDRQQCTVINGIRSPYRSVLSGVPQGSVLGPLLFIIFINDLPAYLLSKFSPDHPSIKLFADDLKTFYVVNSLNDALYFQSFLNTICDWCFEWQLSLNVDKCELLHLGKSNFCYNYGLYGAKLPSPTRVRDLGVLIDNELNFSDHISSIVSKARSRCGIFLKSFVSRDTLLMKKFFVLYVRPILENACEVWNPICQKDINNLENVQRYFSNKFPCCSFLPYSQRLAMLSLDSLHHRRSAADITCIYSIVTGGLDAILTPYLDHILPSITRGHNLKICLPLLRYVHSGQNIISRTVVSWNSLPQYVLNSTNRAAFRKSVSKYLTDKYR